MRKGIDCASVTVCLNCPECSLHRKLAPNIPRGTSGAPVATRFPLLTITIPELTRKPDCPTITKMERKKSIVNYADEDDEDPSGKSSSKECNIDVEEDGGTHQGTSTKLRLSKHDKGNSKYDLKQTKSIASHKSQERSRDDHRHSTTQSHHRQHYSSRDHCERHRDHHRRSRSPSHRRRIRSQSRSRSRDSYHSRHSKHDERRSSSSKQQHKSRRHKSKRDRSRSRSRESTFRRDRRLTSDDSPKKSPQGNACRDGNRLISSSRLANAVESADKIPEQAVANAVVKIAAMASTAPPAVATPVSAPEQTLPSIPKYYNARAVNPLKIATQEEKRKLLWGDTKKDKPSNSVWTNLQFQGDSERRLKFHKLMGIKSNDDEGESCDSDSAKGAVVPTTQEKIFRDLDMQYSIARMSTHTHRGVGLGFSNNNRI